MKRSPLSLAGAILALATFLPAQTWQSAPSVLGGSAARAHGAGVYWNGSLYLLGGTPFTIDGDSPANVLGSTSWSQTPEICEGEFLHNGAAVDSLNRIIVFGGEDASGDPGDNYWWTPQDGNNGGLPDRGGPAAAGLFAWAADDQGRIYAIGGGPGASSTTGNSNTGYSERYVAATNTWDVIPSLPTPVADAAAVNDGMGRILVLGGFDVNGNRTANVAAFDVATSTWSDTAVPDLPVARSGLRAVRGADGRIYAIGGSDGTVQATTYVLDLNTLVWSTGPNLLTAREHFGCAILPDGTIWAMGGLTQTGGTDSCETLFTPTCPLIAPLPASVQAYAGVGFGLTLEVSGTAPFSYQWRYEGVPLLDGLQPDGSTISGSQAETLSVTAPTPASAGGYDCIVTNGCGSTTSPVIALQVVDPVAIPANLVAHNLHPAGALSSKANASDGNLIAGSTGYTHPTYGTLSRAWAWSAPSAAAGYDITPSNSVGGDCAAVANGLIAGWWWWPYTVPQGTGYYRHASVWTNGGANHYNVQSSGWEIGSLSDTDGSRHVGGQRFDETSTNGAGFLWNNPTSGGAIGLTPTGAWGSNATCLEGNYQYGSVHLGFGVVHAGRWSGSANSWFDLNPPGASSSSITRVGDGILVGTARFNGVNTGGIWTGGGSTYQSWQLPGISASLYDTAGGLFVGVSNDGSGSHATLWSGSPQNRTDLHLLLPANYSSSIARDLHIASDGTLTICGSAYDSVAQRTEAWVWRGTAARLLQTPNEFSLQTGATLDFTLIAGPENAGRVWFLGGSASGIAPGFSAGGVTIPLNPDLYMVDLATTPAPWISPVTGTLDAIGQATAGSIIPGGLVTIPGAINLHHAFIVFDPTTGAITEVSPAVPLTILP